MPVETRRGAIIKTLGAFGAIALAATLSPSTALAEPIQTAPIFRQDAATKIKEKEAELGASPLKFEDAEQIIALTNELVFRSSLVYRKGVIIKPVRIVEERLNLNNSVASANEQTEASPLIFTHPIILRLKERYSDYKPILGAPENALQAAALAELRPTPIFTGLREDELYVSLLGINGKPVRELAYQNPSSLPTEATPAIRLRSRYTDLLLLQSFRQPAKGPLDPDLQEAIEKSYLAFLRERSDQAISKFTTVDSSRSNFAIAQVLKNETSGKNIILISSAFDRLARGVLAPEISKIAQLPYVYNDLDIAPTVGPINDRNLSEIMRRMAMPYQQLMDLYIAGEVKTFLTKFAQAAEGAPKDPVQLLAFAVEKDSKFFRKDVENQDQDGDVLRWFALPESYPGIEVISNSVIV